MESLKSNALVVHAAVHDPFRIVPVAFGDVDQRSIGLLMTMNFESARHWGRFRRGASSRPRQRAIVIQNRAGLTSFIVRRVAVCFPH